MAHFVHVFVNKANTTMTTQTWHQDIPLEEVEKAKKAFKEAFLYPTLTSAQLDEELNTIESKWTYTDVSDLQSGKKTVLRTSTLKEPFVTSRPIPYEETELWTSVGFGSDYKRVRLVKKSGSTNIEVWQHEMLQKSVNLTEKKLHGPVYFDNTFGALDINPSGTKVAFIVEKKRLKSNSFFHSTTSSHDEVFPGQEYNFVDDWGEQRKGKSLSTIAILDLSSDVLQVLDLSDEYCYGNCLWIDDEHLIGTATLVEAYRIGIVYTTSKPTSVFKLNIKNLSSFNVISSKVDGICCKSPRLSPSKKTLIWLERDLLDRTHACCLRLMSYNLQSSDEPKVVVEIKEHFEPGEDYFAGLYKPLLPSRCFISETEIIISDLLIDTWHLYRIHLNDVNYVDMLSQPESTIFRLGDGNVEVTDVSLEKNMVVVIRSSLLQSPSLWIGTFQDKGATLEWKEVIEGFNVQSLDGMEECFYKTIIHKPEIEHEDAMFRDVKFSSIYVGPRSAPNWKLILWPHGGPHSHFNTTFKNDVVFWLKLGYAILMPNYRGSLGFGQASVLSLTKFSGTNDVNDCYQAVQDCLKFHGNLDPKQLYLYGGSHGGQLVLHLSGQFPDTFKACIARNPVTNIATKVMVADNPDSGFNQAGLKFDFQSPKPEEMTRLFNNSPIKHATKVKIPIHLNLGTLDRRVPMSQGIEYYRNMKALGKQISMNIYEDNHVLSKAANHANILINSFLFFNSIQQ